MNTIFIPVHFTFDMLFSVLSERACDTLRVIASHHKINEFMQLANEVGYRNTTKEEYKSILENNNTNNERAEALTRIYTLSDFEAFLLEEETEIYYYLGIPMDEDGEPLEKEL